MPKKIFTIVLLSIAIICHQSAYSKSMTLQQDSLKKSLHQDSVQNLDSNSLTIIKDSTAKQKYYFGLASFYSKNLEGTRTATGEFFRHNKMTAASNKFKLNTWLRITNISNEKSIIVRVNDRMHPKMAKKGRIADLTYLGAKKLCFLNKGVTKIKVEIVSKGTKE